MIHVSEYGPQTAPTIVLLHGGGVSGWMWREQVERLKENYRCLVPDLPQHGLSFSEEPFRIASSAEGIADLIESRVPEGRAHLVGLSLGAQVILKLLAKAPEVVDRAVVSGVLVRGLPQTRLTNLLVRAYMPFRSNARLIRANMKSLGVPEEYFAEFAQDTRRTTADSLLRELEENASFRLPVGLGSAPAPVLVTVGEKEKRVIHLSAHDIVSALPNAEGRVVSGVGHNWSLVAPELFARTLRAWVEDEPLPAGLLGLAEEG